MKYTIFFIFLLLSNLLSAQILQQDSLALVRLYNNTGGPSWYNKTNWLSGPINTWYGVTVTGNRVTALNLAQNNLSGSISYLDLDALITLNLANNDLSGGVPEFPAVNNLKVLNLSNNNISALPDTLALPALQYMDLSHNPLGDLLYASFYRLTALKHLNLDSCNISALAHGLDSLNLRFINLNDNSLTVLHIYSTDLDTLWVNNNNLDSLEISNTQNLKLLSISRNNLTGSLSSLIRNADSLRYLDASGNQFPDSLTWSVFQGKASLSYLNLTNNSLRGDINIFFGLSNLSSLLIGQNEFSGRITPAIGNLQSLTELTMDFNNIDGTIPKQLWTLTQLERLWLNNNNLTGTISDSLGALTNLTSLLLAANNLHGTIPANIGQLTKLKILNLSANNLSGTVPTQIGSCDSLRTLDLSHNLLSGSLPASVTSLPKLQNLLLSYNFIGSVGNLSSLSLLKILKIDNNYLDYRDMDSLNINLSNLNDYQLFPGRDFPIQHTQTTDSATLSVNIQGQNTQYIWIDALNGQIIDTNLTLTISLSDTGAYYCRAISPNYTGKELFSTVYTTNMALDHGIIPGEYQALIQFYVSLSGPQWQNNTYWLSDTAVAYWYGITLIDKIHVQQINLDNNSLQGTLAGLNRLSRLTGLSLAFNIIDSLTALDSTALTNLNLKGNVLSSLASLPSSLLSLDVSNNFLTFEDLEPIFGTIPVMVYSPQHTVGKDTLWAPTLGESVVMTAHIGGSSNVYQWYKDDQPINGANDTSLIINSFTFADTGTYYCAVTNKVVTGLTIKTGKFEIIRAFRAIFHITDTANNPIKHAEVTIYGYSPVLTDSLGNATVNYLDTGRQYFSIIKTGFAPIRSQLYISETGLDTAISMTPITVKVMLSDQYGPLHDVPIMLIPLDTVLTDQDGIATFWYVPSDTFLLSISWPPYRLINDTVVITGESKQINYDLSIRQGTALSLFPNPSDGQVVIHSLVPVENAYITIYDMRGKKIFSKLYPELRRQTLYLNLKPGLYLIDVRNSQYHWHAKLIIY